MVCEGGGAKKKLNHEGHEDHEEKQCNSSSAAKSRLSVFSLLCILRVLRALRGEDFVSYALTPPSSPHRATRAGGSCRHSSWAGPCGTRYRAGTCIRSDARGSASSHRRPSARDPS